MILFSQMRISSIISIKKREQTIRFTRIMKIEGLNYLIMKAYERWKEIRKNLEKLMQNL